MQLKSLLYFSSVVAGAFGATVQDVMMDMNAVHSAWTTLFNDIKAFPDSGGSPANVLTIFVNTANVLSATDTTTNAVKTIPTVSVTDGIAVLAHVNDIFPIIEDFLARTVARKPVVDAIGTTTLALEMLEDLGASTTAFENALVNFLPPLLLGQVNAANAGVNAAFAATIATFSSKE